jgi:hypothetical protein
MRYAFLVPAAALAAPLLLGCSDQRSPTAPAESSVSVQPAVASAARGEPSLVARPLSGRCTTVVSRLAPPPPIEVQRIEYTCQISHLGLTHAVVTQTVNVITGALSNNGVYVAANGDQLNSAFTGSAQITFTSPTTATVTFEGTQEFSQGTGRFANANGTARLAGSAELNPTTGAARGEFTLDGTLTY